jgi:hypothetical protein
MISVFSFLIYLIIRKGHSLETTIPLTPAANADFSANLFQFSTSQPLPVLLLQVVVIIVFVRVSGFFFRKTGQPAVIGEIVAGIVLGPSVLGVVAPAAFSVYFSSKFISQPSVPEPGRAYTFYVHCRA